MVIEHLENALKLYSINICNILENTLSWIEARLNQLMVWMSFKAQIDELIHM